MFEPLLEKIAQTFDEAGLPYMIIGGQAVLIYGEPRLTRDIDVTMGATLEHLHDVLELVEQMTLRPLVDPETFTKQTMVLPCQDPETGIRVDFAFSFSLYEQQALQRVRRVKVGKTDVRYVAPEDLIIHKVVAGRPRDLEDVKNVLLKIPEIDQAYIRRWLDDLSIALGEPFLKRFEDTWRESQ